MGLVQVPGSRWLVLPLPLREQPVVMAFGQQLLLQLPARLFQLGLWLAVALRPLLEG